jgi:hypothetical protein
LDTLTETIRTLMTEALRDEIGAQEDFFMRGGDSLAVQHVLTGLSDHLGQEVPGWLLLDHPTARSLAQALIG